MASVSISIETPFCTLFRFGVLGQHPVYAPAPPLGPCYSEVQAGCLVNRKLAAGPCSSGRLKYPSIVHELHFSSKRANVQTTRRTWSARPDTCGARSASLIILLAGRLIEPTSGCEWRRRSDCD